MTFESPSGILIHELKVPGPIVTLLCLTIMGTAWYFGAKKHSFLEFDESFNASIPHMDFGTPISTEPLSENETIEGVFSPKALVFSLNKVGLTTEVLQQAPGLSLFHKIAQESPESLPQLALYLERQGELELSRLVYERMIDSSEHRELSLVEVRKHLLRLSQTTSMWVSDPAETTALTLHLSSSSALKSQLVQYLQQLTPYIYQCSGGLVKLEAELTLKENSNSGNLVSFWVEGTGPKGKKSQTLTKMIPSSDASEAFFASFYELVSAHLSLTPQLLNPPPLTTALSAKEQLSTDISRWMWMIFAQSL